MVRLASLIPVFPGQNSLNPAEVPGPLTVISTSPETVSLYVSLTRVEIGSTVEEPETLTDPEIDSSEVLEELIFSEEGELSLLHLSLIHISEPTRPY